MIVQFALLTALWVVLALGITFALGWNAMPHLSVIEVPPSTEFIGHCQFGNDSAGVGVEPSFLTAFGLWVLICCTALWYQLEPLTKWSQSYVGCILIIFVICPLLGIPTDQLVIRPLRRFGAARARAWLLDTRHHPAQWETRVADRLQVQLPPEAHRVGTMRLADFLQEVPLQFSQMKRHRETVQQLRERWQKSRDHLDKIQRILRAATDEQFAELDLLREQLLLAAEPSLAQWRINLPAELKLVSDRAREDYDANRALEKQLEQIDQLLCTHYSKKWRRQATSARQTYFDEVHDEIQQLQSEIIDCKFPLIVTLEHSQ